MLVAATVDRRVTGSFRFCCECRTCLEPELLHLLPAGSNKQQRSRSTSGCPQTQQPKQTEQIFDWVFLWVISAKISHQLDSIKFHSSQSQGLGFTTSAAVHLSCLISPPPQSFCSSLALSLSGPSYLASSTAPPASPPPNKEAHLSRVIRSLMDSSLLLLELLFMIKSHLESPPAPIMCYQSMKRSQKSSFWNTENV